MIPTTAVAAFGTFAGLVLLTQAAAWSQTIERLRLTDNDLSCTQIYAEAQQMDTVMALAGPGLPAAVQPAALPPAGMQAGVPPMGLQGAVIADPQVQAAIARARASGMSEAQINATLGLGLQRHGLGGNLTLAQMHAPTAALMTQQGVSQEYQQAYAERMAAVQGNGRSAAAPSAGQAYAQAGGLAGMFGALAALGGGTPATPAAAVPPAQTAAPMAASGSMGAQAKARKDHLTAMFLSRGCKTSDVQK